MDSELCKMASAGVHRVGIQSFKVQQAKRHAVFQAHPRHQGICLLQHILRELVFQAIENALSSAGLQRKHDSCILDMKFVLSTTQPFVSMKNSLRL